MDIREIGFKSSALNIVMFLLTVGGGLTYRAPGTTESWIRVRPVQGPPRTWKFAVPDRSAGRWSPAALRRLIRRLESTGRRAHLGSPELAASLDALHRLPRFPFWRRNRAVDRIVDSIPAPDRAK
ncbi:hypothetical protein [Kitasatospora sp. NBC_00458]|uniref:hypothetical protein n=1 Tax=Kitasatospora sp. NBC_00458 TaxID=2903568 RepID=UPI002E188E87